METAQEVTNAPLLMNPLSFDQMKDQCEALMLEKQQKMAALLSFKLDQDPLIEDKHMNGDPLNEACYSFYFHSLTFNFSAIRCSYKHNVWPHVGYW